MRWRLWTLINPEGRRAPDGSYPLPFYNARIGAYATEPDAEIASEWRECINRVKVHRQQIQKSIDTFRGDQPEYMRHSSY